MVERVRRRCGGEGLEAALERKEQLNRKKRVLDGTGEARLVTLACSRPPEGYAKWTLQLPEDRLVELEIVDSISKETVRRTPTKTIQALETETMVYPAWTERRLCVCHGGCA